MATPKKAPAKRSAFAGPTVNAGRAAVHPLTPASKKAPALPTTLRGEETLTPFATRLPPDFIKRFKTTCIERDLTMQEAVYAALRAWVEQDDA